MLLALAFSILIGVSLGMLGGGGSILTVPILVYVLGVELKRAFATSLVVVGLTSLAAIVPHARARRVRWRTGALFGLAGMVGAYFAGRATKHIPPEVLLFAFAAMMLVTAIAMMRGRREPARDESAPHEISIGKVLIQGFLVGSVAGLVGAGGGFLIVPALVLLGGLPMNVAVGTSLLVIAMQSFAGLAGYLGHVTIDWRLAAMVSTAAVMGSVVGGRFAGKIPQQTLRQVFAWFVVLMAFFVISRKLPETWRASSLFQAIFVQRWPWWVGGAAISALVLLMLLVDNKLLGVSTGCAELCRVPADPAARKSWRPYFLIGIVFGGLIASMLGGMRPTFALGLFDGLISANALVKIPVLLGAGVLIGYGARMAGGCTSGHSIVGVPQWSRASLVATGAFMLTGFAVTQILMRVHA